MTQAQISRQLLHPLPLSAKVAIILNGNAREVNEGLIRELGQVIQDETLFVSRSLEQSKFIARTILNKGFDVVLCGGGDGTYTQCITDIMGLHPARPPAFGILRLGTGNAVAEALGASPANSAGLSADLRWAHSPEAQLDLPLLRVEGRLAPFAGVGLDSLILADYNGLKDTLRGTPLKALGTGAMGYTLSIATQSFWRVLFQNQPVVTIRNEGAPTQRINLQGDAIGHPIPRGGLIYRGQVTLAAASTVPFYGLGLRLFPLAQLRKDRFQLRIGNMHALSILSHLPALFRGELDDPRLYDFPCTAVSIQADPATPVQIGGDEVGLRQTLRIELSKVRAVGRILAPSRIAVSN